MYLELKKLEKFLGLEKTEISTIMQMPGKSREETVWHIAAERYKQHKNNELALSLAKAQVQNPFAVATAQAQQMGFSDFSEGSPGKEKRGEIAEALKQEKKKSLNLNEIIKKITKEDIEKSISKIIKLYVAT